MCQVKPFAMITARRSTKMSAGKKISEYLFIGGAFRKAVLGGDSCQVTREKKAISSLSDLCEAAITQVSARFMRLLLAIPFITFNQRPLSDQPPAEERASRQLSLRFTTAACRPQDRPGTELSQDALVEDPRLRARLGQELHGGHEGVRQEQCRIVSAMPNLRRLPTQPAGVRSSAERYQRHGSGLLRYGLFKPTSNPQHRTGPTMPRLPSFASNRPSMVSCRDELCETRKETVDAYSARRRHIVDDIDQMLDNLNFQRSWESVITTCRPAAPPRSQSWVPRNLAMAVSRVYYYSGDYAEELISAPLKVSGYTVRLAVRCFSEDRCVKLLFRAQFCFDSGNDAVQWPFRGAVKLVIHHPRNCASNYVYTVHPSQGIETVMPRSVDNAFFYLAGPISALSLDRSGYWAMETLHLSIMILPVPEPAADS